MIIMDEMLQQAQDYLDFLCVQAGNRAVGTEGNRKATAFFRDAVRDAGWDTFSTRFEAMDWEPGNTVLEVNGSTFTALPGPYSIGCEVEAQLVCAESYSGLEAMDLGGKVLLLYGDIAREQIMPKKFTFYNPEEHQQLVALLEAGQPAAIISATGRNSALAGGVYPFPMFEDGDLEIPSVYMTEEEGQRLAQLCGTQARLVSTCRRIPSFGYNVTATRGSDRSRRILVCAHIDAKKGTPGAIDNATGVIVLLTLAQLLKGPVQKGMVELAAFNGEDYFAVPGQKIYLEQNMNRLEDLQMVVNIDGAGYHDSTSACSFFNVAEAKQAAIMDCLARFKGITRGDEWYQGDHSIFAMQGRPAIAFTSRWFIENMENQGVTHTPGDHPGIVNLERVVEIAAAIKELIDSGILQE